MTTNNEKVLDPKELPFRLKRITDGVEIINWNISLDKDLLSEDQKNRVHNALQEIIDVVYEKHFGHKRLEVL